MDTKVSELPALKAAIILIVVLLITTGLTNLISWGIDHIKLKSGT